MLSLEDRRKTRINEEELGLGDKDDVLSYCLHQAADSLSQVFPLLNKARFAKKKNEVDKEKLSELVDRAAGHILYLCEMLCIPLPPDAAILENTDDFPAESSVDPFLMLLGMMSSLEELTTDICMSSFPQNSEEFQQELFEPILDYFTLMYFVCDKYDLDI